MVAELSSGWAERWSVMGSASNGSAAAAPVLYEEDEDAEDEDFLDGDEFGEDEALEEGDEDFLEEDGDGVEEGDDLDDDEDEEL